MRPTPNADLNWYNFEYPELPQKVLPNANGCRDFDMRNGYGNFHASSVPVVAAENPIPVINNVMCRPIPPTTPLPSYYGQPIQQMEQSSNNELGLQNLLQMYLQNKMCANGNNDQSQESHCKCCHCIVRGSVFSQWSPQSTIEIQAFVRGAGESGRDDLASVTRTDSSVNQNQANGSSDETFQNPNYSSEQMDRRPLEDYPSYDANQRNWRNNQSYGARRSNYQYPTRRRFNYNYNNGRRTWRNYRPYRRIQSYNANFTEIGNRSSSSARGRYDDSEDFSRKRRRYSSSSRSTSPKYTVKKEKTRKSKHEPVSKANLKKEEKPLDKLEEHLDLYKKIYTPTPSPKTE